MPKIVFAMKTPHIRPKCIQVFVSYTFIKNHPVSYIIIVRLTFSGIGVMLESLLENHIHTAKNPKKKSVLFSKMRTPLSH